MKQPTYSRAEPDVRRRSLIDATSRVLAKRGASGISVRHVAVEADVSPGLVSHYFEGVDSLIAATYEHVGAQVATALQNALAQADGAPQARLDAYVTASFVPPIAEPNLLATWIAFWSLVRARPDIAALHDKIYASYRADLEILLLACGVPESDAGRKAIAIAALVDGLWLELCLSASAYDASQACGIARDFVRYTIT